MKRATCRDYEDKVRLHIENPETGIAHLKLSRLTRKAVNEFRDRMLAAGRSRSPDAPFIPSSSCSSITRSTMATCTSTRRKACASSRTSRIQYKVPGGLEGHHSQTDRCGGRGLQADADRLGSVRIARLRVARPALGDTMWGTDSFASQRADFYQTLGEPKMGGGSARRASGADGAERAAPLAVTLHQGRPRSGVSKSDRRHPDSRTCFKARARPLCAKVGVALRWHDMRHFAVSLWIEQGFSIKEVMTFAGHSSVQMTMERYGHLFRRRSPEGNGPGRTAGVWIA